ncbi:hypothetical protein HNY42_09055 [Exiguobacterium sp. Helios]|uniref:hypothetical protein n=1 Tax=Exiguobacterium sp. Helios TaxID=2735868 RepID=UPI00165D8C53|nr:hypothetical protein [Exiguobacterium sp. Helios]QNR21074.1 hypothetical protein HNY42_09055 [Exiguobacterium sp. Helios]
MKILIDQPKQETQLEQLRREIAAHPEIDMLLYPEGYCRETDVATLRQLAKQYATIIVTGYRDADRLDRALIINTAGDILLDRAKTPEAGPLYTPSTAIVAGQSAGYLLCREIFLGLDGLKNDNIDIIFNPIGVGMFSEEQYTDWSGEAQKISRQQRALFIGTSHADGSYRNCGFSIPTAFAFDATGEAIFLSKDDPQTRILDTVTKTVEIIDVFSFEQTL